MIRFAIPFLLFASCFSACTRTEKKESADLPELEVPPKVSDQKKYNSVIKNNVKILGLLFESSGQEVRKALGKPSETRKIQNEFDGSIFYEYQYGNNSLQISSSDTLTGFDIRIGELQINDKGIKIGDSEQIVQVSFPLSYKNRLIDNEKSEQIVRIQLTEDEGEYIVILSKNGMINEVLTWSSE